VVNGTPTPPTTGGARGESWVVWIKGAIFLHPRAWFQQGNLATRLMLLRSDEFASIPVK